MSTKSFTKKLNKILLSFILVIGLFTSACSGLFLNFSKQNAKAVYAENVESIDKSSTFISNYNFSSTSSSSTPPSANNWTKITDDNVQNPENLVTGVFNSYDATVKTDENYLDKYKLLETPGHATNQTNLDSSNALYKSLMINSYTEYGRLGFKSPNFTLEADSYYMIEVILKTVTADNTNNDKNTGKNYSDFDSHASIYLMNNSDNSIISSFEMIQSEDNTSHVTNGYARYKMYVSTETFSSLSTNLQLYLGSKDEPSIGPVFFNQVKILQLSQNRYLEETKDINVTSTKVVNLNEGLLSNVLENPSFESDWRNGWTLISKGNNGTSKVEVINGNDAALSEPFISAGLSYSDVPYTNNSSNENKSVLMMYNSEENYVGLESSEITIAQHGYYKLDVWAFSNSGESSKPTIKLVDKSDRELTEISSSVTTSVSTSVSLTNGWSKHTFYICGDPYKDVNVALQLWLGTDSSNMAKGYAYFDDVTLQSLSYTEYNTNKNSNVLNYSISSSSNITNSNFNLTNNENNSVVYPLTPSNWTPNVSKEYAKSGVVNISSDNFIASDLKINNNAAPAKPADLPTSEENASNNVLMIASSQENLSQSYTSDVTSLTEEYYVLTLWYNTTNGGVGIKVYNDNGYIYNTTNLSSNDWQKFELAIKKDANSLDIKVELSLSGVSAYAYFDEVNLLTSSKEYYDALTSSTYVKKVDLTSTNFENTYDDNSEILPLNGFSVVTTNAEVESGIVNLAKGYAGVNSGSNDNKFALMVSSESDVYYYLENNNSYSLAENAYYKVTVDVLTYDLRSESENYGARIYLSGEGLDKEFTNISTNGWQTYSFLIKSTTATTATLQLGLGTSEEQTSGMAFFDNITFSTLEGVTDDASFENLTSSLEDDANTLIINSTETNTPDDTDEDSDTPTDPANIWFIIPSLISALALVLAIVITFVRKINWKKPTKKVKTTYDRKKTLEKDLDRREKIELRKQMISELEQQLKDLNDEIARYLEIVNEKEKASREKIENEHKALVAKKSKTTAEKEALLRERNEKIALDKNAFTAKEEEEFLAYIKKLELKEAKEQKAIANKEIALKQSKAKKDVKLQKYLQKQEQIKKEIERIDKEIEEIAREEAKIWEEYKRAKQEAKVKKAEYKQQLKNEKAKKTSKKSTDSNVSEENTETNENTEVEVIEPDKNE